MDNMISTLRTTWYGWMICLFLMGTGLAERSGIAAELQEVRGDWDRWIELRKSIQAARSDWEVQKGAMDQMALLLERHRDLLKQRLDALQSAKSQGEKERLELSARRNALAEIEGALNEGIVQAEEQCRTLALRFPPPLKTQVREMLGKMPKVGEKSGLGPGRRMQNVLGFLNEADKFNGVVTLQREIREIAGGEVQCDTIYLGLGQAFYVDPNGVRAGIGHVKADEWVWESRDSLGPDIRKLVDLYRGDRPAELVEIPLEVR